MAMDVIKNMTEPQRLALAERLVTLTTDTSEDSFVRTLYLRPGQQEPLLGELEREGYVHRDRARRRLVPGPLLVKERPAQPHEERRLAMLKASPVGRAILANDTKTPKPKPGGMSAERRAALLGGSAAGRGILANEKAKQGA